MTANRIRPVPILQRIRAWVQSLPLRRSVLILDWGFLALSPRRRRMSLTIERVR